MMVNGDRNMNNNYNVQGSTGANTGRNLAQSYYSNFAPMNEGRPNHEYNQAQAPYALNTGQKMSLPPISSFTFPPQIAAPNLPSFREVLQSTMASPVTTAVPIYPSMNDSIFGGIMGSSSKEPTFSGFSHGSQQQLNSNKYSDKENKGKKAVFISLFNSAIQKRPRRKFEEVNRIYGCLHPGCEKKYGALNHLNAHIKTQKHGRFRKAYEFKDAINQQLFSQQP